MGDLDGHDLRQGTVEGMGLQLKQKNQEMDVFPNLGDLCPIVGKSL